MRVDARRFWLAALWVAIGTLLVAGCGNGDGTAPTPSSTALLSVAPAGAATGVATTTLVTTTFSGPMMAGMEQYLDLHQGDASGPLVPMACAWSADRTKVTCTPAQPLAGHTPYTIHMGGGMMDADDHPVDLQTHLGANGGEWLMPTMMGGMHAGMPMNQMGSGWKGTNGSYGMLFPFTTG